MFGFRKKKKEKFHLPFAMREVEYIDKCETAEIPSIVFHLKNGKIYSKMYPGSLFVMNDEFEKMKEILEEK